MNVDPGRLEGEIERLRAADTEIDFSGSVLPGLGIINDPHPPLDFGGTTFLGDVYFNDTRTSRADFANARFKAGVFFHEAKVYNVNFEECEFDGDVTFDGWSLLGNANFTRAWFKGSVTFENMGFVSSANFHKTIFDGEVKFIFTDFNASRDDKHPAVANFAGAVFRKPELIQFHQVNKYTTDAFLASFLNVDVQNVRFNDVHWYQSDGRLQVQDELRLYEKPKSYPAEGDEIYYQQTAHEVVAVIYRQLMTNFEKQRSYDLAEECFIGVMEMKRLDPRNSRFVGAALSLYRAASVYGSSYERAFKVLALLLVLAFPVLFAFPLAGVQAADGSTPILRIHGHRVFESRSIHTIRTIDEWIQRVAHVGWRSLLMSLETATLQRQPTFKVTQPFGNLLKIAESVLIWKDRCQ